MRCSSTGGAIHGCSRKVSYENQAYLIDHLGEKVITPAESRLQWMSPQASLTESLREIEKLRGQLAELQKNSHE